MNNPFFWLGVSILLVAISLMALLLVAILTLKELARAARSAEKLLDTLNRELPVTLHDLRLTGKELSALSDEVSGSMQSARSVVQQVDRGLTEAKASAQQAQITTRSLWAGATAAFQVLAGKPRRRRQRPPTRRPPVNPTVNPTVNPPVHPTVNPPAAQAANSPVEAVIDPAVNSPVETAPAQSPTQDLPSSVSTPAPQDTGASR